jgi:Recombination directionality factor-like
MPIAGLTTTKTDMPRLGKIRKGGEQGTKTKEIRGEKVQVPIVGKDLDYFRIVSDRPGLEAQMAQLYGQEPKELRVVMPYHTVEEVFDPWMKEYGKSGLKRQCDGAQQILWLPEGAANYRGVGIGDAPLPCVAATNGCKCQRTAALKVVLPEVFALGHCGYFEIATSSKHDILSIGGALNYVFGLRGSLLGVPFIVRRSPEEKSYPNPSGTRSTKEYNLIKIEVDPAWLQRQYQNQYAEMMGTESVAALPSAPMTYASVTERLNTPAIAPAVAPPKKTVPQWQIDLDAAGTRLGLSRDKVKAIAADNNIALQKVSAQTLAELIELMEIEAENGVLEAELVEWRRVMPRHCRRLRRRF